MPTILKDRFYTLSEASKATRIPRGRLDHACRVGRIPYTRTDKGDRLLAGQVVVQLAKDRGFASFPRPYDPVGPPYPATEPVEGPATPGGSGAGPTAADRLGLLGEPSQELKRAKEQAEAEKLKAEQEEARLKQEQVKLERERLRREHEEELEERRRVRDEELRAEEEAEAERVRLEAEERRESERQRREGEERDAWVKAQFLQALDEAGGDVGVFGIVPDADKPRVKERILLELLQELRRLTPRSLPSACADARRAILARVLNPFRCAELVRKVFSRWRNPIKEYLDQLHQDGWVELDESQRQFLAQRWQPEVQERVSREYNRRGGLTEAEAQQVIEQAISEKLGLSRRRNRSA